MLTPDWLKGLFGHSRSARRTIRHTRAQRKPAARSVELLEDRTLLTSLNSVIDAVLEANNGVGQKFDPAAGATTQPHVFTTSDANVPNAIDVGEDSEGQADLRLNTVTLTFATGVEFTDGSWTGQVAVTAPSAVLYPGLLNIAISDDGTDTDDGDDADTNAVVGVINLATGTAAELTLDNLSAADIGLPSFLDVSITDLDLKFADFRGDDTANTLELDASIGGIKTGSTTLDAQLESDLTVTGSVIGLGLNMDAIKSGVRDAVSGNVSFPSSPISDLSGITGNIDGELFAAEVDGAFIINTVTVDPDGDGPKAEQSVLYAALRGTIGIEEIAGFGFAFAFSELGPLQVFAHSDVDIPLEPRTGLVASNLRLGARFSTTIEDLQTETDFTTTKGTFDEVESQVTLEISDHDLAVGNVFRVRNADTASYDGEFTVLSINGDDVTYAVDSDPGIFAGDAEILRVTITDPLDLRDSGLTAGIAPPEDVADWQTQLDQAVTNQIKAGGNVWDRLFSEFVLGGGATLSFDPRIPAEVLQFDADFMLGSSFDGDDVSLSLWLKGELSLYEDTLTIPASMYGDLGTSDETFSGKFLFLADVAPNVPEVDIDPILVYRGSATFEPIMAASVPVGFTINLAGGVDLNVPEITTVTLEGTTTIEVIKTESTIKMDLDFDATLSEKNVGVIASANGAFHTVIDTVANTAEVWGAALLGTDMEFLEQYGLFATASGIMRINTTDEVKPDEILLDEDDEEVPIALPAESFALRLDGSVDFRIDHNADGSFSTSESVYQIAGSFVLEFSSAGFNVALFKENPNDNSLVPATLKLGAVGNTLMTFGVLGFMAIRDTGFAADLVLTVDASLPLSLTSIKGTAVLIVNTTEEEVVFEIPGGAGDPNRPTGLTVTIPKAAPKNPSAILTPPDKDGSTSGLNDLITGSPTWTEGADGAYGVVFIDAEMDLLNILEFDVTGYVLLSDTVLSMEANLYAGGNFLGLASGSVDGSIFFSSEGEFEVSIGAKAQLGPSWININGGADLKISYLDENGKDSGGEEDKELNITGSLNVGLTVDVSPFPKVDVDIDALSVAYNSGSGDITVSVTYPEPFWDRYCVDLGWFGSACFPYPNVRNAPYSFTVGNFKVVDPPPPPVLGQVDASGVLTVNAGNLAARTLRNLRSDEINESVIIDATTPRIGDKQTITLRMFDVTQEFADVTAIKIVDMDDGKDIVEILSAVKVPGTYHLGAGADRLVNRGKSSVTVYGDAGADRIRGGSVGEALYGGAGHDVIEGGGGTDTIQGNDGNDTLLVAVRGDESQAVNVNLGNSGFTATIGTDPLPFITDIENLSIENEVGREQSDTFTLNYLDNTKTSSLGAVNLNLGADGVQDTVIVNGSGISDTFDMSTSKVMRRVTVATDVPGETKTTETEVDTIRVAQRDGISIDMYDVGSGFGSDAVTVNAMGGTDTVNVYSTLTGTTFTANGGDGLDTFNVASRATEDVGVILNDIAGPVFLDGNAGADVLNLDDSGDEDANTNGRLTGTSVTGAGIGVGVNYGTMGSVNIS
ncbi:MAG: hypothetical protein AB8G99_12190, partial [Planctomycetaceae bacterium]